MSGYIIEEPEECPIYYNTNTKEEITEYWKLYSPIQRKRFKKVLRQLNEIWFDVYKQIKFMRDYGSIDIENSNSVMYKVYKLFIIQLKNKIEFYNDEKLRQRKQKNYISKKINKLKNGKQKL